MREEVDERTKQQVMQEERAEQREANERKAPSGKVLYRTTLQEGEMELRRPSAALFWSGLAAGLSMGLSMIAEALLTAYLPEAAWRPLVATFGYSMGFLVVILARQQLFTENTLTPILPLLQNKDLATLRNVLRLWAVVLAANLTGGLLMALVAAHTSAFDENVRAEFFRLGEHAMQYGFGTTLLRGILAGWVIALMVWLLPFAETARVWVIILMTYVVGIAHFSHVIAGSIEVFTLAAAGRASWPAVVFDFVLPALLGNILGGVTLVAVLNHAQVVAGNEVE
ncbi:formate/nitrite transporter family protein [Hymenobacter rubripertinctus]|uniref:Formate/nitrite transporter family protein n=1 Tax=Hymenobacter rubripertinctus TaxID=2029981 RepID=A0A418QQ21_9BACT|nr:formate/nitrite transporter family protein [Hymenobacter rubripertinctus]RIY07222.1 formate/nitrite transporter family protein [Hymenobacter rubripertinctus]